MDKKEFIRLPWTNYRAATQQTKILKIKTWSLQN